MAYVEFYLGLLLQEYEELGRLVDLARQKRSAILEGASETIVSLSESEETVLKSLLEVRDRRHELLSQSAAHSDIGVSRRGVWREVLERQATLEDRPRLKDAWSRYERRLLELRRATKTNNVLLSDRLLVLHRTVEVVLAAADPKGQYDPPASVRRKSTGSGSPLVLDQKV